MSTAPKRVVGKPFVKGDPRINRGGRPPALLSKAMQEVVSDADAAAIMKVLLAAARKGELQAIQMLWDRMEGKAVARQEQGDPGAFTGLEDHPTDELLRIVEKAG
jgi:hypothetical protein